MFDDKVHRVYEHIYASYFDDGESVYTGAQENAIAPAAAMATATLPERSGDIGEELLSRAQGDPELFAKLMTHLFGAHDTWFQSTEALIDGSETRTVEFKQSARWSLREDEKDRMSEQIIVKTVAGFLNAAGGTLLIGVTDGGDPVGLDPDYQLVKPRNADGFVNWLDTLLDNHLGKAGAQRVQIRVDEIDGKEVCRVDVPASSRPIWVHDKVGDDVLYVRRSNSTRAISAEEANAFIADRFRTQAAD